MRYKLGEKVVLRDDFKPIRLAGKKMVVESFFGTNRYQSKDGFVFEDDMIDHEKTAELQSIEKIAKFQKNKGVGLGIPFPPKARRMNGNVESETQAAMERLFNNDAIEPPHYRKGEIDLIESWYLTMPFDGFRWAMKSHIHKYIYRYELKNGIEDLNKAMLFIRRLKEYELKEKEKEHD